MKRATAAAYLDLTPARFDALVNDGVLPLPVKLGNSEHWSRRKIDEALETLHGGTGDWRSQLGLGRSAA